jgi:steroid delta-isomerase-like uncharacterized protein
MGLPANPTQESTMTIPRILSIAATLALGVMQAAPAAAQPRADGKALVRKVFDDGFNHGNVAIADQLVAEDCIDHSTFKISATGREAIKQRFLMQRKSFPDLRFTFDDMIAEGDRVVWRWTMSGTDLGGFMGRPPTGKAFEITGVNIQRIADGRIVEHWSFPDVAGLTRQLAP